MMGWKSKHTNESEMLKEESGHLMLLQWKRNSKTSSECNTHTDFCQNEEKRTATISKTCVTHMQRNVPRWVTGCSVVGKRVLRNPHVKQQLRLRWPQLICRRWSSLENGRNCFCWIICTCKHAKLTHITLTTHREACVDSVFVLTKMKNAVDPGVCWTHSVLKMQKCMQIHETI